jgi:hypothetical protein
VPHQVQEQVGQRGRGQDGAVQKEDGARKRVEGLGSMLLSRFFSQKKNVLIIFFQKLAVRSLSKFFYDKFFGKNVLKIIKSVPGCRADGRAGFRPRGPARPARPGADFTNQFWSEFTDKA